jgi:hypothetical protein
MIILKNKKENWNFLELGNYSISSMAEEIESYLVEWSLDIARQKEYVTHEDTMVYILKSFDYLWFPGELSLCKNVNNFKNQNSINEITTIYNSLEEKINGKAIRSEIVNMKPYGRIRAHRDRGDNAYLSRRIHIPIKTNEYCFFTVGDETINMEIGKAYEINNSKYHKVFNGYSQYRIHLIVDILPAEHLKNISFE